MSLYYKEKEQILYVNDALTKFEKSMSVNNDVKKYSEDVDKDISTVKNILNNTFYNGFNMNIIVYFFYHIFFTASKYKKNGIFRLFGNMVEEVMQKFKILTDSGASGDVYNTNFLAGIPVIVKMPKSFDYEDDPTMSDHDYFDNDMIREYFIGLTSINKLRCILPNFVYTFGAFICPFYEKKLCKSKIYKGRGRDIKNKKERHLFPFIFYEKIQGNTLYKMIDGPGSVHDDDDEILTFPQYLGIFMQVLLALEVSQREISFTHFDLHTDNLICKTIKKDYKYSVPLDNKIYEVVAKKYIPTIIDFGESTVKYDGVTVGSYALGEHGMKHYMLQGADMFKFLLYSCLHSKGDLQKQILELMSFYGKDDPYKVLVNGFEGLYEASQDYVEKGSYSRVTVYTPLEFLDWILKKPEYKNITSMYMKKKERNINVPLSFSTNIQPSNGIFLYSKFNFLSYVDKYIKIKSTDSYIMSTYLMYILNLFNKNIKSKEIQNNIDKIKGKLLFLLTKYRVKMIQNDYTVLWKYKKLLSPDIIQLKDDSKHILEIKINSEKLKTKTNKVKQLISKYYSNTSFFITILQYLQFIYIIKEIKLEKIYHEFLTSFETSLQYKIYNQNLKVVNQTSRWCQSLLDSIS